MNAIYLDPKLVPQSLRIGYNGTKFKAFVATEVTVPADAGLWSGGSRETFVCMRLVDGVHVPTPGQTTAPWNKDRAAHYIQLQPGFVVVKHSMFCGKDMGLTFFVHPDNAAAMLPASSGELSEMEKFVLDATCSFKSSYNGKDRYDMATDGWEWRGRTMGKPKPTREAWDAAKQSLIEKRLLNKAGAVTPAGRNARVRVL